MTDYRRTPEQLRASAWESYEASMHEYLEIRRLWREYKARHGGGSLSRMKFLAQYTIKDAIEEQQFAERLMHMHTTMYHMEVAQQKREREEIEWQQRQAAATD